MKCWCLNEGGDYNRKMVASYKPRYQGDVIDWSTWPLRKRFESTHDGKVYWANVRAQIQYQFELMDEWTNKLLKRQRAIKNVRWSCSVDEAEAQKKENLMLPILSKEQLKISTSVEIFSDRIPFIVWPRTSAHGTSRKEDSQDKGNAREMAFLGVLD